MISGDSYGFSYFNLEIVWKGPHCDKIRYILNLNQFLVCT